MQKLTPISRLTPAIQALTFLLLLTTVPQLASAQRSNASKKDWKLVWSDEFDGNKLDYTKWEIEVNAFGGGNNELQIYTDRKENVRVADGNLIIEARRDNAQIAGTSRASILQDEFAVRTEAIGPTVALSSALNCLADKAFGPRYG